MPRPFSISPFFVGDPVVLKPDVDSAVALSARLALEGIPAVLPIAPGVVLAHILTRPSGATVLRWVRLPHGPRLAAGLPPAEIAVVLTAPVSESGRALRLVSRLSACLAEATVREAAVGATSRESLVRVLAEAEEAAGEAALVPADVLALLGSGPDGLTADEAARRLQACGLNRLERIRRRPLIFRFFEQLWTFFAVLLWIGGACAFLAGMPELGWAIFGVIVVNGVFSFLQEYRAERAVEALQDMLPQHITVRRGGGEAPLGVTGLVPGDLVRLEEGDQVPADGQLLSAEGLRVDQSALTGEAHPVFKLPAVGDSRSRVPLVERQEFLFAGTGVVAGSGTMLVLATGMQTEIGAIAHLTQTVVETPSPLQREMGRVTRVVTILAVSFGVAFFALGTALGLLPVVEGLLFALGVIVANVPEGLLPTLTLALALGVQGMARRACIVKRLSAVETLGATTVICTDKTGTLTQGRMEARFVWVAGRARALADPDTGSAEGVADLFEAAALASHATAEHGDPTEVAMMAAAGRAGVDVSKVREAHPLLAPHPFDSFRKRMTLIRGTADGAIAFVKGAPRETLALCESIRWGGRTEVLTEATRQAIVQDHDRLAAAGLRMLAVATRPVPDALLDAGASRIETQLTFLGMVALWDPPRPEVGGAMALCQRAGIRVVMVTGDYGLTAQAIARQVGLRIEKVVTGEEVERLASDALQRLLAEPAVLFARTSPAHKLTLVSALTAAGHVVAVTGDGVNDAPALKAAAVGVAMGRRGSEVAKEAAVMVITDDNFASIVAAIQQGRAIYANIGKFVTYIFASNVPELVPYLAFVLLGIPLPLTVMQILAVDLVTDLLPALALGAEPPEPGVMDQPPRARRERLLDTRRLLHAYGFLGAAEAICALAAFFWTYWLAGWRPGMLMVATGALYRRATTMTFAGIVASQVGNVFACRTDRESVFRAGFFGNPYVFAGIAAEVGLLLVLILTPPLAGVFGLAPLGVAEWGFLLWMPPAMLLLEEGRKALARARSARASRAS
jgi:calcium-translocating P-type ATPase